MPRQARIDYPGALHHIIGRGIERRAIFQEEADKESFLKRLRDNLSKSSMRCFAWCVMDNHFHLLLETGKTGLSEFMRRLLTSYAVYYNVMHKRSGHLFQNRYKSIICDKEQYLLLLIRYIHLNPVKAKIVDIGNLSKYRWTGHKEMTKNKDNGIIEREEVLGYFGQRELEAQKEYERFVMEGIGLSEDYDGGGLIRSAGGITELMRRRFDEKEMYDERILGDGNFVELVHAELETEEETQKKIKDIDYLLDRISVYYQIERDELLETRKEEVRQARNILAYLANKYLGLTGSRIGKMLGIKEAAVSISREKGRQACLKDKIEEKLIG